MTISPPLYLSLSLNLFSFIRIDKHAMCFTRKKIQCSFHDIFPLLKDKSDSMQCCTVHTTSNNNIYESFFPVRLSDTHNFHQTNSPDSFPRNMKSGCFFSISFLKTKTKIQKSLCTFDGRIERNERRKKKRSLFIS